MAYIYNLTDTWNAAGTTFAGIKMAVTNTASSASSNLLDLTVSGATTASFAVDKSGNLNLNGAVNKVTITAPATGATLTIANGKTLTASNTLTFTGTDSSSIAFGSGGTVAYTASPTLATPTFTTSATGPLFIGGTGTTSTLTLRTTSGAGATGSDVIFQTGNNGAVETMRILNSGFVGIGTANPGGTLHLSRSTGQCFLIVQSNSQSGFIFNKADGSSGFTFGRSLLADDAQNFFVYDNVANSTRIYVDSSGNFMLGTISSPTTGTRCLTVASGTAATATPADTITLYSRDLSAGNTIPSFYCEGSGVTNAAITNITVTNKIAMNINGTVYYLLATTSNA